MIRRLVIVTYDFPPVLSPGSLRMLKLVRYLPEVGWSPIVVTCANAKGYYDPELVRQVPDGVPVFRVRPCGVYRRLSNAIGLLGNLYRRTLKNTPSPGDARLRRVTSDKRSWGPADYLLSHLFIPDHGMDWLPRALPAVRTVLRQSGAGILLTTSPPHSMQLIGLLLKKVGSGRVHWVADFRDPWLDNAVRRYGKARSHLVDLIESWMERAVVTHADLIIANTKSSLHLLLDKYPHLPRRKLKVLPNGFDPLDFQSLEDGKNRNHRMIVTFAGYYYGTFGSGLLDALELAVSRYPEFARSVQFRFIGEQADEIRTRLSQLARWDSEFVAFPGVLPHSQVLAELRRSDLLLCLNYPGEEGRRCVPSKLYEYLAVGRPILVVGPPGESWRIIEEAQAGQCVDPSDASRVAETLWEGYSRWRERTLAFDPNREVISRYRRDEQAKTLAHYFDELGAR